MLNREHEKSEKGLKMNTTTINARIDVESKNQAQEILEKLGLSMSGAIDMFFKQVVLHHGIPFDVKLPNKDTVQAIEELESGKGKKYTSTKELFKDLNS